MASLNLLRARTLIALSLCAAVIAIVFALLANAIDRDEHFERILQRGVLRVGMDASFPPFEWADERGALMGLDVDLANELGRRMSLRVELVNTAFDALYEELRAGRFDVIISALPYDPSRTRDVNYSQITLNGGAVLVVRAGDSTPKRPADLQAGAVAVEAGSNEETMARRLEARAGFHTLSVPTLQDAAQAMIEGRARAMIADGVSARLLQRGDPRLMIAGDPLSDEPNYVIAMPVESPKLLAVINRYLDDMKRDGSLNRIRDRWL
ncbi:MAG: amino acid ABC transporter substrate-binding protein [Chloroflexi bacterium]|nr:amino acid ABC transporter substrate-binding protein [Chloroflexota bacterium]